MADIENLAVHRVTKTKDARDWTPLDALRDAIEAVESGAINPDMVYVAFFSKKDDGTYSKPYRTAGGRRIEVLGLLTDHLHMIGAESKE